MKKKIYRERYYKNIEHDETNFGNKKVIKDKKEIINLESKKKKSDKKCGKQ